MERGVSWMERGIYSHHFMTEVCDNPSSTKYLYLFYLHEFMSTYKNMTMFFLAHERMVIQRQKEMSFIYIHFIHHLEKVEDCLLDINKIRQKDLFRETLEAIRSRPAGWYEGDVGGISFQQDFEEWRNFMEGLVCVKEY